MSNDIPDHAIRRQAVETLDRHVLVSAGAGTGKTSVLVERYIQALANPDVSVFEVIAVTFTEKAAAEMKARARSACRQRLRSASGSSRDLWLRHVRDLDNAPISTIHGLCANILREFPLQAGLDPGFNLLGADEAGLLLARSARESFLDSLEGDEPDEVDALAMLWDSPVIVREIAHWVERRDQWESIAGNQRETWKSFQARWSRAIKGDVDAVVLAPGFREGLGFLLDLCARGLPAQDKLALELEAVEPILNRLFEAGKECGIESVPALAALANRGLPGAAGRKKAWEAAGIEIAQVRSALRDLIERARTIFSKGGPQGADLLALEDACARASLAFTRGVRKASHRYQKEKSALRALDFNDLLIVTRDLLRRDGSVRRAVASRCKHLMIDEFQDTNGVQKELLWYVAGARPAENEAGLESLPRNGASLFIVGDVKQSIYRFRSADVSVFKRTAEQFKASPGRCLVLDLQTNFRSRPELVDGFFNSVFDRPALMGPEDQAARLSRLYRASYTPLLPSREPGALNLPVPVDVMIASGAAEPGFGDGNREEDLSLQPEPVFDGRTCRFREAEIIARRIKELLDARCMVEEKQGRSSRQARLMPRHIALLFRAMTDAGIYETALRAHGIPTYTLAGKGFFSRQECLDLLSFLRCLCNRQDALSLLAVLRSPFAGISDETLFLLSREGELREMVGRSWNNEKKEIAPQPEDTGLAGILPDEWRRLGWLSGTLERLRQTMHRFKLSELLEEILRRTGYSASVLMLQDGSQRLANLRKLTRLARSYESGARAASPEGFASHLALLAELGQSEPVAPIHGPEDDVVTLSTIHAAKGLEWPLVFLPDLGRESQSAGATVLWRDGLGFLVPGLAADSGKPLPSLLAKGPNDAEKQRESYEEIRLLYVACTRAREGLHLSGTSRVSKTGRRVQAGSWLHLLLEGALEGVHCPEWPLPGGVVSERVPLGEGSIHKGREIEIRWWDPAQVRMPEAADLGSAPQVRPVALRVPAAWPDSVARRLGAVQPEPAVRTESATSLAAYLQCPMNYLLSVRHGLARDRAVISTSRAVVSQAAWGVLMHRILHRLLCNPGAPVSDLVEGCIRESRISPGADPHLVDRAESLVRSFRASQLYDDLLHAEVLLPERQLLMKLNGSFVTGVVDLLYKRAAGGWVLIDYKTGDVDRSLDAYVFQLGLYACMIEGVIQKGSLEQAALYELESGRTVPLELARDVARAKQRAGEAVCGIREERFTPPQGAPCDGCSYAWACEGSPP